MPWPEHHKAQTRQRIVEAAAAAFRERGIAGVRLDEVMARAGLTHGGFYAHFASKEDLLAAALQEAAAQTVERLSKPLAGTPAGERLQAVIDTYLSPAHVQHPGRGCPLAALGPEVARTGRDARAALADGLEKRLSWMRELLPADARERADDEIIGALACMVGGVILARLADGARSGDILRACRTWLGAVAARRSRTSGGPRARPPRRARSRRRAK